MVAAGRVRLSHAERRRRLCELAVEVFGSRAFDEVSMDDIAAKAGVSKGLLYHYFPSKGDFFVAAVEYTSQQILEVTEPDMTLPPPARAVSSVDAFLGWAAANQRAYWTFAHGGLGVDPRVSQIGERHRKVVVARILRDHPGPVDDTTEVALHGWVGFLDAITLRWLATGRPSRRRVLAATMAVLGAAVTPIDASSRVRESG